MTENHQDSPLDWIMRDILPQDDLRDAAYINAQADLEAYIELELDGQNADGRYPHVRPTLIQYADLREEYETLRALLADVRAGLLVDFPVVTDFDLSFLKQEQGLWASVQAGEKKVIRLAYEVLVRIARGAAAFGELPAVLTPQLIAVPVRKATGEQATAEILNLVPPEAAITIRLQLGPASHDRAIVSLQVTSQTGQPPVRRVRASLLNEPGQLLISAAVDEAGWVTFRDIAPGHYRVRISLNADAWEVPLAVEKVND